MGACYSAYKLKHTTFKTTPFYSLNGLKTDCKVVDVYDGDTITIVLNINGEFKKIKCRLNGIDTPELKKNIPNDISIKARNKCIDLITNQRIILNANTVYTREYIQDILSELKIKSYVECGDFDKYGRLLITIYANKSDKLSVNKQLLQLGLAKEYFGGTK